LSGSKRPDKSASQRARWLWPAESGGIGIFLIGHDIHDVFDHADRISVMLHGKLVGTVNSAHVSADEIVAMIIMCKPPRE